MDAIVVFAQRGGMFTNRLRIWPSETACKCWQSASIAQHPRYSAGSIAGHASCTKLIKLASRRSAFSFLSRTLHAKAKLLNCATDVLSKFNDIHALKIPWFTHFLALDNQASHLRLAQTGRNGCGRLIDLGRELAGFLQLVEQRHNCYFSTGRSIGRCAFN